MSFSRASQVYSTKFLSVFKPPPTAPLVPQSHPVPGLEGVMSDSGVARVFGLEDGNRAGGDGEGNGKGTERRRKRADRLPKHANVFTGRPTPDVSVYPSSSSGEATPVPATTPTPTPVPPLPATATSTPKVKKVAFMVPNCTPPNNTLPRMPSLSEPCPSTWPGATSGEVEQLEAEVGKQYREETWSYTIFVEDSGEDGEEVHVYLPVIRQRRRRRLPREWTDV